jgi:7,8-dihydropterin-6-yl-methyl-4-(beta-D-ribofuranosyl)aminobenzene 5'-phosphate synthase
MTAITVLCDNTAGTGLESEHGLSLLLENGNGGRWLWDTGQTDLFLRNARRLGLALAPLSGIALSHGHYDHTGGLAAALAEAGQDTPVFAHPGAGRTRYTLRPREATRSAGLPGDAAAWPPSAFTPVGTATRLAPGMHMLTDIPRLPGNFQAVDHFYYDRDGGSPDPIPDDACLVAESGAGRLVVLGCCHSGLANTLAAVAQRLGPAPVHAVIGGLHLKSAGRAAWDEAAASLREHSVARVHPGHCTGADATAYLEEALPGRVRPLQTGMRLTF